MKLPIRAIGLSAVVLSCAAAPSAEVGSTESSLQTSVALQSASLCTLTDANWDTVLGTTTPHSVARTWDEMTLALIRRDVPMPGVHARNLYTVSVALYEVWARFHGATSTMTLDVPAFAGARDDAALTEAMHYAAYRVLSYRYNLATNAAPLVACSQLLMSKLGQDVTRTGLGTASGPEFGNAVGDAVLRAMYTDGANERNHYADTTGFVSVNMPLDVSQPGATMRSPSAWQPLKIAQQYTQNGIFIPESTQVYIGAQWGQVEPFGLSADVTNGVFLDVGRAPYAGTPDMNGWLLDLFGRQAELEANDDLDVSPGGWGNNALGANDGHGRANNPVTGAPYAPNLVNHQDFAQTLAEFWADGPNSETPPGHWNVLANQVSDTAGFRTALFGQGEPVARLEWDVKMYLALNGTLHDSAIAAWGLKRRYVSARPISLIRYAAQWQSGNPDAPNYEPEGLPLVPGLVEQVTRASASDPSRHFGLTVGDLAVRTFDGVRFRWISARSWVPFQAASFVTPAFPGFVSGHSTFSRAAATVLAALTGTEYFPGGLGQATVDLSVRPIGVRRVGTVQLQWATFYDAADQAGISRIYGGIHLGADDFAGRKLGAWVGEQALARVRPVIAAAAP